VLAVGTKQTFGCRPWCTQTAESSREITSITLAIASRPRRFAIPCETAKNPMNGAASAGRTVAIRSGAFTTSDSAARPKYAAETAVSAVSRGRETPSRTSSA
jgi:hypothetical protein